jgi:putative DNA primase/helicase
MRSLCGDGSYAAIPLVDFSKQFALEPLTRATAIIVDENDVGTFIDKAANLKAVITNDVIPIDRKFKTPISYQFYGFMVQCLNEFPRIKDRSDSFYRRQLFIPFDKCFTGRERKYIKNDYLHRPEVLEYVLYKVLTMNFYTLSEPESCKAALDEYKDYNDPVRQFLDEMLPQFVWDLVPFSFLYELYKAWFKKNSPSGSIQGRTTFVNDVCAAIQGNGEWYCQDRKAAIRPGSKMQASEHLIAEYDLKEWMNPSYTGGDVDQICRPRLKSTYNGLLRYTSGSNPVGDTVEEEK